MLQIERISLRHREIPVRLGGGERRITTDTWCAFGLALAIHLLAFLILDFSDPEPQNYEPPISILVSADLPLMDVVQGDAWLPEEGESPMLEESPFISQAMPTLPSQLSKGLPRSFATTQEYRPVLPAFEEYADSVFYPEKVAFDLAPVADAIQLQVSGPLARLEIEDDAIEHINSLLASSRSHDEIRVRYHVQVDTEDGLVFWLEPDVETTPETLDRLARYVLNQLRFSTHTHELVIEGQIDLVFHLEQSKGLTELVAEISRSPQNTWIAEDEMGANSGERPL